VTARSRLPEELELLVARVLESAALELHERSAVEADLRAHFEDGIGAGVSPAELERRFGDPEVAGAKISKARLAARRTGARGDGGGRMEGTQVWNELRHAVRRLGRAPGFAAIVTLTLALGVGANTAIFTVLDAVVLEPLPYRAPERLVRVYEAPPGDPGNNNYLRGPTSAAYRTWDEVFERFAALYTYRELGADLTAGDRPERITVVPVTAGYFETLGVAPVLGRTFVEAESFPAGDTRVGAVSGSGAPVTVLSHGLWERLFASDRGALGRSVLLNDVAYEVVGVMPPGFDNPFGPSADAWIPQDLSEASGRNGWGNYYLSGVGRLRDGLSVEAAQERASALYVRLREANPDAGEWGPRLEPLHADLVGSTRRAMLWILTGAAALVLLTACLNVANLIFARGLGRSVPVGAGSLWACSRRTRSSPWAAARRASPSVGQACAACLLWRRMRCRGRRSHSWERPSSCSRSPSPWWRSSCLAWRPRGGWRARHRPRSYDPGIGRPLLGAVPVAYATRSS
jgi:putative ABC transport system permease protein